MSATIRNRSEAIFAIAAVCALLAAPVFCGGARAAAPVVSVAAAADLTYCLDELNAGFKKAHPEAEIKVSYGSSGNFLAQIKNGAPFEVFMSADMNFPRELAKAKLADESSLTLYAIGQIVLWTTRPDVDVTRGLEIVRDPAVKKFAIANPDHAPYGRAAKQAIEHDKLWDATQPKLVMGENIAQTAQFVETGNADAGVVALSLVLSPKLANKGRYQIVPPDKYQKLEQGAVLTKAGGANPLAKTYLEYLRSPEARGVFDRYGFRLPEPPK